MAKPPNGTRMIRPSNASKDVNLLDFHTRMSTGLYDKERNRMFQARALMWHT